MPIIYVDKPKGITSNDLCQKLKKYLNTTKIGHTGTLDPNATGLMIVLFDEATKANQFMVSDTKEYIATVKIGIETDSLDIDGNILSSKELKMPSRDILEATLKSFIKEYEQYPPLASAIKYNGKKLYEYLRKGEKVEVKPRKVKIYEISLLDIKTDEFIFKTKVSSGTYIRSLVKDILDELNLIGVLSDLRRTKINDISIDDAYTLSDIENNKYKIISLYEELSKRFEVYKTSDPKNIIDGKRIKLDNYQDEVLIVDEDNRCLAVYKKDINDYKCVRGLF